MDSTISIGTGEGVAPNPLFLMTEKERVALGYFLHPRLYKTKPSKVSPVQHIDQLEVDGQEAELALRRGRWEYCHKLGEINGIPSFRGTMQAWNDKGRCLVRLATGRLVLCSKDSFIEDKPEKEDKVKALSPAKIRLAESLALLGGLTI